MPDKTIVCKDCHKEFVFTEGEQEFYKEKGFENEPQRCPECRKARKQKRRNFNNNNYRQFSGRPQGSFFICLNLIFIILTIDVYKFLKKQPSEDDYYLFLVTFKNGSLSNPVDND